MAVDGCGCMVAPSLPMACSQRRRTCVRLVGALISGSRDGGCLAGAGLQKAETLVQAGWHQLIAAGTQAVDEQCVGIQPPSPFLLSCGALDFGDLSCFGRRALLSHL
jgi:hypothetical protein